jgi:hypothetical protein
MINSLSLNPFYRETWGAFDPLAIAQLSPLAYDPCYQPKYYKAPDDDQEMLPAGGYLKYGLEITPGGLIWGIYHVPPAGINAPGFVFKITDMSLGIELFDVPIPDLFVSNAGSIPNVAQGFMPLGFPPAAFPWLLNAPYPVVGSGLFNVEFWNNSGAQIRVNMVLGVCEVNLCA